MKSHCYLVQLLLFVGVFRLQEISSFSKALMLILKIPHLGQVV